MVQTVNSEVNRVMWSVALCSFCEGRITNNLIKDPQYTIRTLVLRCTHHYKMFVEVIITGLAQKSTAKFWSYSRQNKFINNIASTFLVRSREIVFGCASFRLSRNVANFNEKCAVRKEWFESRESTGHQEGGAVRLTCMTVFFWTGIPEAWGHISYKIRNISVDIAWL